MLVVFSLLGLLTVRLAWHLSQLATAALTAYPAFPERAPGT